MRRSLRLTRDDETWRLAEKAGHRANVPKVRELLLKLSRAKLLEEKTSNPEYYKRLGVDEYRFGRCRWRVG